MAGGFSESHDGDVVAVESLSHCYGRRRALDDLSFSIRAGELFVFLGPNGSGKTTLFRILSTLVPYQSGTVRMFGQDLGGALHDIRRRLGVVFQAPSLDAKLTVAENLACQAALYGLAGRAASARIERVLGAVGLLDRKDERAETLSGGLRRRVELAKGLLHDPDLILMDEPSTGLDPGARVDFWHHVRSLRAERPLTVVLTTHLLDEADRADRIAILDQGKLVAVDTPEALKATVGGDTITLRVEDPETCAEVVRKQLGLDVRVLDQELRLEHPDGHRLIPQLVETLGGRVQAVHLGRPTLEDVFIAHTGHRFRARPSDE